MIGFEYSLCMDVGSERDNSAFTVLKRNEVVRDINFGTDSAPKEQIILPSYDLIWIERPELKTPYLDLKHIAARILNQPKLVGNCHFLMDATGTGMPVVQIMQDLGPTPVVITSGHSVVPREEGGYTVPKRFLISAMQGVLQSRRIRIADGLKHTEQLTKEIIGFKMRYGKTMETYEAQTEATHDDLVMSLAINLWFLEKIYGHPVSQSNDFLSEDKPYDPFEEYR